MKHSVLLLLNLIYIFVSPFLAGASGFIVIKSNPSGAYVYVNGENTGLKTPFQKSYDEGDYLFRLISLDYDDYKGSFVIKDGETVQLTINLTPKYGRLYANFTPLHEVIVSVDGVPSKTNSPYINRRLKPGNHTIVLNKKHYDELREDFSITRERTTTLRLKMTPDHGGVNISTSPEINPDIIIDGNSSKLTSPCFVNYLAPGKHTIVFKRKNFAEHSQIFEVAKGINTNIEIKMIPNFGGIKISTTPEINANISIDEKDYESTTPFFIGNLSSGTHSIILSKDRYETHKQNFFIGKGQSDNLEIMMKPKFSNITIVARYGDEIFINNKKEGVSRFSGQLLSGNYTIEVKNSPNYYPEIKKVEIIAGKFKNINFQLKPKTGTLSVMVNPLETDVYLNNKAQGKAPKFISNITTGTYTLKLQKTGYKVLEKQIVITENETLEINESLTEGADPYSKPKSNKITQQSYEKYSSGKYGQDSVNCVMHVSLYREFYKQWRSSGYKSKSVNDALENWRWVFVNCPRATENIYINGVKMIAYKVQAENSPILKQRLLRELMMVFDQRIEYFPVNKNTGKSQVGKILGRKGYELYKMDPSRYKEAFYILKESIEMEQVNASASSIVYYFRASIGMVKYGGAKESLVTDTYNELIALLEANISSNTYNSKKWQQWENTKGNIETSYQDFLNKN